MRELARAVTRFEEQVEDVRELRKIVERFDMEIAARMDEIEMIGTAVLDLHGDLDNQIAEYDYIVLLLTALRDDEPVPDLALPLSAFENSDAGEHPRLTQDDLNVS
jgi:hypothetical protein